MRRGLVLIESTRFWVLVVSVPQVVLWSLVKGSGGGWMIAAHSALVLVYFTSLDLTYLREGIDPRLSFARDRFRHDARFEEMTRSVLLLILGLACMGALFVEPWLSLFSIAVVALILLRVRSAKGEVATRRLMLAELSVPASMILLPALLIGSWEWGTELEATRGQRLARATVAPAHGVMGGDVVGSAIATTVLFSVFVLLCLLRDEAVDRLAGLRTTVTHFGREFCVLYTFGLLVTCLVLCAYGAGMGWWGDGGWRVVAVAALATMIVVWSLANRTESRGAGAWLVAAMLSSILMASGVLSKEQDASLAPEESPAEIEAGADARMPDQDAEEGVDDDG